MIRHGPLEGAQMDPQQWLLQYDEKLKEVAARAERAEQALQHVGGTATSPDDAVTVQVSASGVTTDLVLRSGVRAGSRRHQRHERRGQHQPDRGHAGRQQ